MRSAFKAKGKLAAAQTVRLTEFYPGWTGQDVAFEVFRQGHRRPLNALLEYSQDDRYSMLLSGNGNPEGEAVEVSEDTLAKLVEIGGVDAMRRLAIDSVLGRVYDFPVMDVDDDATAEEMAAAEVKTITVGLQHPEREELLLELLSELPGDFLNLAFERSAAAEKEFTEETEAIAGKSSAS